MARKIAVTWINSTKSARVTLDGDDIVAFWDRDDKLFGSGLTVTTSDETAGTYESDPVVDSADATTALSIDLDAGSHNYVQIAPTKFAGLQRYAWFTSTEVEGLSAPVTQAAAFAKCDDGTSFANLAVTAGEGGYTANFQLLPDTPAAADAFYFGAAAVFDQIDIVVGTAMVYDEAACLAWEYYDGDSWETLTIVKDGTGSTGTTGVYFGEQTGRFNFTQPADWATVAIDSQTAYWIRAVVQADKADNVTTSGIVTDEHAVAAASAESAYVVVRDLK